MKAALVFVIFPVLTLALYFGVFAPNYHARTSTPQPASFSCGAELASLAALDAGRQIAPLCGQAVTP
jgi:hypothetical protein